MILLIPLIIAFIVYFFKSKYITLSLFLTVTIPYLILSCIYLFMSKNIVNIISGTIMIILYIGVMYKLKTPKLKYNDFRIWSVSLFINNFKNRLERDNDFRIIGNVVPHKENEIQFNNKLITQTPKVAAEHGIVAGRTGVGKTYLFRSLVRQDIHHGRSVIFCDYKGSGDNENKIIDYALKHNYKVFLIKDGIATFNYDPMRNINDAARIEALMSSRTWSESYYEGKAKTFLNTSIPEYTQYYEANLRSKGINYLNGYQKWLKTYKYTADLKDGANSTNDLLNDMLTSVLRSMFNNYFDDELDITKILNEKFLIVLSFSSNISQLATKFSAIFFADLLYSLQSKHNTKSIMVYGDESSSLETPKVWNDILSRGRDAGLCVMLGYQSLNQVNEQTGNDFFLNSVLDTISTKIILSSLSGGTAELISNLSALKETYNLQTLKSHDDNQGIYPTAFYLSSNTGIQGDFQHHYIFKPYIYDEASEKETPSNYVMDHLTRGQQELNKHVTNPNVKNNNKQYKPIQDLTQNNQNQDTNSKDNNEEDEDWTDMF